MRQHNERSFNKVEGFFMSDDSVFSHFSSLPLSLSLSLPVAGSVVALWLFCFSVKKRGSKLKEQRKSDSVSVCTVRSLLSLSRALSFCHTGKGLVHSLRPEEPRKTDVFAAGVHAVSYKPYHCVYYIYIYTLILWLTSRKTVFI